MFLYIRCLPCFMLLVWLAAIDGKGDSVTLTPVADTSLFQKFPGNNVGGSMSLASGDTATEDPARALVRFLPSTSIPSGVTVTGARLEMSVVRTITSAPTVFDVHRLLVDWGEGNKGAGQVIGAGQPASDGEATWEMRFHPTVAWNVPGGSAGSDYAAVSSASAELVNQGVLTFASTVILVSDVQAWIDNPASNFGWLVKARHEFSTTSARRFGSREHPDGPPRLVVDYEEARPRITSVAAQDGRLCLRFQAQQGSSYVVERRAGLQTGPWEIVSNLPPATVTHDVTVCDLPGTIRFYRVGRTTN